MKLYKRNKIIIKKNNLNKIYNNRYKTIEIKLEYYNIKMKNL